MDVSDLSDADFDPVKAALKASGIHTAAELRWAAAVGAVQLLVRRSPGQVWEQWHSTAWGLDDGEMMRANVVMTRVVHARLDLDAGTDWSGVAQALTDPARTLPDGRTLRQYAGRRLVALRRDVRAAAEDLAVQQVVSGPRRTHLRVAAATLLWGSRWYGMPAWPVIVETFCCAVEDPGHPHWRSPGQHAALPARPPLITDTAELRRRLLVGPDTLDAESARWCIIAQLPYVDVPPSRQG